MKFQIQHSRPLKSKSLIQKKHFLNIYQPEFEMYVRVSKCVCNMECWKTLPFTVAGLNLFFLLRKRGMELSVEKIAFIRPVIMCKCVETLFSFLLLSYSLYRVGLRPIHSGASFYSLLVRFLFLFLFSVLFTFFPFANSPNKSYTRESFACSSSNTHTSITK